MCLGREQSTRRNQHTTNTQIMKARLPRQLTSSARINLNQHWAALESLVPCHVTFQSHSTPDSDATVQNQINENIANERLEASCTQSRLTPESRVNMQHDGSKRSVFQKPCSKQAKLLRIVEKLSKKTLE